MNRGGRPKGRKLTEELYVRLDPETKERLARKAYEEDLPESELVRRWIREAAADATS